jgi:alanine racemase
MFPAISIERFAELLGADIRLRGTGASVQAVVSDSRQALWIQPTAFLALQTQSGDGHQYALHAAQQGAVALVVAQNGTFDLPPDLPGECSVLVVDDPWAALRRLAAHHRREMNGTLIAITGSNGKTTVKEYLYHLLGDARIARSPKSFNSQLGVPLSLLSAPVAAPGMILEVGVGASGDMALMAPWVRPNVGIFTHLGDAHAAGFSSGAQKAIEKAQLFAGADWVVVPAAESEIAAAISVPTRSWSWNTSLDADLMFRWEAGVLRWTDQSGEISGEASCPALSAVEAHNVASALTCIFYLGWPWNPEGLSDVRSAGLRMERLPGVSGWTLLNDAYTSDLDALGWALESLAAEPKGPRYAVVATPIGVNGFSAWMDGACAARGLDGWWGIGSDLAAEGRGYPDVEAFRVAAPWESVETPGVMLLKGPRRARLEALLPALKARHHDTVLGIDLEALAANLRHYKSKLSGQRIMAMVKANAYGLGAVTVAQALAKHHIDYFGVAYVDEGLSLRQAGIQTPIMVMNPGEQSVEGMLAYGLEPEIFHFSALERFGQAFLRYPESALGRVHIKVDTGMHRLGFQPDQGREVGRRLAAWPGLEVASVMTHLASAEDAEQDAWTAGQGKAFELFYEDLVEELGYRPIRHLANTPGVVRHARLRGDMVRLGIGLYGDSPVESDRADLQPVVYVQTRISHLQDIPAGEGVSYGHGDPAPHIRRIATLPVGYADGFPRTLSFGQGEVVIHGRRCPVVGAVCMDMTLVDVTAISPEVGDAVEIVGAQLHLHEFAQRCGTISYEVLTRFSERLGRTVWNPNA